MTESPDKGAELSFEARIFWTSHCAHTVTFLHTNGEVWGGKCTCGAYAKFGVYGCFPVPWDDAQEQQFNLKREQPDHRWN